MLSVSVESKYAGETKNLLQKISKQHYMKKLDSFGAKGVDALTKATPRRTGQTANSWKYRIDEYPGLIQITWSNAHAPNGVPVALLLQYGHATRSGSFVEGVDYINPALKPIFDKIAKDAWEVITK